MNPSNPSQVARSHWASPKAISPRPSSKQAEDPWLKAPHRHFVAHAPTARCEFRARRNRCLSFDPTRRENLDCWKRAIGLARMLKGGAGERLGKEDAIMGSFHAATRDTSILALDLANFLIPNFFGSHAADLARRTQVHSPRVDGDSAGTSCLDWSNIDSESTPIKVQIAKNLENEAARTAEKHIVAARLREEAMPLHSAVRAGCGGWATYQDAGISQRIPEVVG